MLPIFPENSLAASFVVTVWIGIIFLSFFNRRLGWPMSGLVVPGLLAPIMMAKPFAGVLIGWEAALTYVLVRWASRIMPRLFHGSEWFGRDRFFAILLFSVPVRIVLEGYALPLSFVPWWQQTFPALHLMFDTTGIGLVIVPLLANQFWKPGLARGLWQAIVATACTYAVITLILIPFTNFDFNNLSLILDALHTRVTDSPKSYIILLTTAFAASQVNLLYGWDFGGILFPGLIALALFDPLRLATTLGEAVFLFFAGTFVLQLPYFRSKGVEGSARTLLFFTLAFAYRLLSGHLMQRLYPEANGQDFLALGFLISTMLAMRASEEATGIRLIRSIGQVSVVGAVMGLAISFGFLSLRLQDASSDFPEYSRILPAIKGSELSGESMTQCALKNPAQAGLHETRGSLVSVLAGFAKSYPVFFSTAYSESYVPPPAVAQNWFRTQLLQPILKIAAQKNWGKAEGELRGLAKVAAKLGYELTVIPSSETAYTVIMHEGDKTTFCHRGVFVFASDPVQNMGLYTPKPIQEAGAIEAAVKVFQDARAAALFIPTAHPQSNADGSADNVTKVWMQSYTALAMESWLEAQEPRAASLVEIRVLPRTAKTFEGEKVITTDALYVDSAGAGANNPSFQALKTYLGTFHADVAIPDGGFVAQAAPSPSAFSQRLARRFSRVDVAAMALNQDFVQNLAGVVQPSYWERQWRRFGGDVADLRTELAVACNESSLGTLRKLWVTQDFSFALVHKTQANWQLLLDRATGEAYLSLQRQAPACEARLQVSGRWSAHAELLAQGTLPANLQQQKKW